MNDADPKKMVHETHRLIYEQDCAFLRSFHDRTWSRIKIVTLVEGSLLAALFGGFAIDPISKVLLVVMGSMLVLLICLLALRDHSIGKAYESRVRTYESFLTADPHYPCFVVPKNFLSGSEFIEWCAWVLVFGNLLLALVQAFIFLCEFCAR
jgi:hypothetical protein